MASRRAGVDQQLDVPLCTLAGFHRAADKIHELFEAKRRIPILARVQVLGISDEVSPFATKIASHSRLMTPSFKVPI